MSSVLLGLESRRNNFNDHPYSFSQIVQLCIFWHGQLIHTLKIPWLESQWPSRLQSCEENPVSEQVISWIAANYYPSTNDTTSTWAYTARFQWNAVLKTSVNELKSTMTSRVCLHILTIIIADVVHVMTFQSTAPSTYIGSEGHLAFDFIFELLSRFWFTTCQVY